MNKHPPPWTIDQGGGYIVDANDVDVARVDTPDTETRAVLLHAAEMWEAVNKFIGTERGTQEYMDADRALCVLAVSIQDEIEKGKP